MNPAVAPLRILYIEDNPLIVFHLEAMIEDLGHVFAGSVASFAELVANFDSLAFDVALVDIDLTDGRTGPAAAAWLKERNIPSIFVTGQVGIAEEPGSAALDIIAKPVSAEVLGQKLEQVRPAKPS